MIRPFAAFVCALLMGGALHAQTVGVPEWSNVPYNAKNKAPATVYGPYCSEGNSYDLVFMGGDDHRTGYAFPTAEDGVPTVKFVPLPQQKAHFTFNGFCAIGGRPCVLYDSWDTGTGEVTFFAQRYTPSFDPDGTPVRIGMVPLDPKAYKGGSLDMETIPSPDGTKILFLFDDIQQNGIKLAMCWVMDRELNELWSGAYRIPVQALGATSTTYLLDNEHVYIDISAVLLNEENTKEGKDGEVAVKVEGKFWKHSSHSWFDLHGETFNMWDGTVPGTGRAFDGMPAMIGDRVVMGGYQALPEDADKNAVEDWVLLEMDDAFRPTILSTGTPTGVTGTASSPQLLSTRSGALYLTGNFPTTNGIGKVLNSHQVVQRFDATGRSEWTRTHVWGGNEAYVHEDLLILPYVGHDDHWEAAHGRDKWNPYFTHTGSTFFPFASVWDESGQETVVRLMPPGAESIYPYPHFNSLQTCGCYLARSTDKARPGLVRTWLDRP